MASNSSPTVSVILPTYDRVNLMTRAIDSVLEQTYSDFELLVVDDASNDETQQVLDSYDDERLTVLTHETNRGCARARQTAIGEASGTYLAFIDSDDYWYPEKLTRQQAQLAETDAALCYVGKEIVDSRTDEILARRSTVEPPTNALGVLLKHDYIGSPTGVVIRRDVYESVGGFDTSLPNRQDWELWIRVCRNHPIAAVPEILARRYVGHGQMTDELRELLRGTWMAVTKHRELLERYPTSYARQLIFLASMQAHYDRAAAWSLATSALRHDPWLPVRSDDYLPNLVPLVLGSLLGKQLYRRLYRYWYRNDHYLGRARI